MAFEGQNAVRDAGRRTTKKPTRYIKKKIARRRRGFDGFFGGRVVGNVKSD